MMKQSRVITYSGIAIALLIVLIVVVLDGGDDTDFDTVIAERGELVQEVSVTGRVVSVLSADMAFEKSGRVGSVAVEVGDTVFRGQTLISLQNGDVVAQINQARAVLKREQANLDELKRGSREEEIEVQRVKVLNAEVVLAESKKNLVNVIADSFTKSDDAVRAKTDQFFSEVFPGSYEIDFTVSDTQLKTKIETGRSDVEFVLDNWQVELLNLSTAGDLSLLANTAKTNLSNIKSFLNNTALAVNALTANSTLSQTTVDGYKTAVSTARANVNTAITNLSTADEELRNAEQALKLEEQQLILKEAGATPEELVAQEARVEESLANVQNFQAQFEKTIIRAPFSGLVTFQDAKVGEIASANKVLISLISPTEFEIETFVPEADVAKIAVGDSSRVTLDAYSSDDLFLAEIISISPAETIIEGVATYKTTLLFVLDDERIKSGMTANIDVLTEERSDVIIVPGRAVISKDNKKIVRVVEKGSIVEVPVVVGVRGSDGSVEIISGIEVGDEVVVFINE